MTKSATKCFTDRRGAVPVKSAFLQYKHFKTSGFSVITNLFLIAGLGIIAWLNIMFIFRHMRFIYVPIACFIVITPFIIIVGLVALLNAAVYFIFRNQVLTSGEKQSSAHRIKNSIFWVFSMLGLMFAVWGFIIFRNLY